MVFSLNASFQIAYILTNLLYHTESIIDPSKKVILAQIPGLQNLHQTSYDAFIDAVYKLYLSRRSTDAHQHTETLDDSTTSWKGRPPSAKTQELPTLSCH